MSKLSGGLDLDSKPNDKTLVLVSRLGDHSKVWSWSRDLVTKVLVLVSRPGDQGLGIGLETW